MSCQRLRPGGAIIPRTLCAVVGIERTPCANRSAPLAQRLFARTVRLLLGSSGMSDPRQLRCYQYVTVEYERVRDALRRDAVGIFQRATATAASRAEQLASTLRVSVGALEMGANVQIVVRDMTDKQSPLGDRRTEIELTWSATSAAALFPSMEATLTIYPLSAHETQLDLHGRYRPPLGAVGQALDALVGHRIAEASVLRFVQEVAARINAELGAVSGAA